LAIRGTTRNRTYDGIGWTFKKFCFLKKISEIGWDYSMDFTLYELAHEG